MRARTFVAFAGPSSLVMAGLLVVPLVLTLSWSFQDVSYGTAGRWIGLQNYAETLASPRFRADLVFTVVFTVAVTVLTLVVGYALALLLSTLKRPRPLFLGLLLVPYVVPVVVGALAFGWLFNSAYGGPLQGLLASMGLDLQWLSTTGPARVLLVLNSVWNQAAFPLLILLAGLMGVPDELVEAASIDGAGWFRRQRYVILPHLSRLILLIVLISVMDNLRVFDQVQTITPSAQTLGTESIMSYTYNVALGESTRLGLASAISVLTMILTFVLVVPLLRQNYRDLRGRS